jgi:hypothetical protein
MKKTVFILAFLLIGTAVYAQRITPALEWGGQNSAVYWGEQEVVVSVGREFYTYLMYNSRGARAQITSIVFNWFARHNSGYIIDYSNVRTIYPNEGLSENVKNTMVQRNCDISFTIIEENANNMRLVINFRSDDGRYYTTVYYFYRLSER